MNKLGLLLLLSPLCLAQIYTVTLSSGGSGYTTAPTLTATGGACTSEPTFTTTVNAGVVLTAPVKYAGIGCTSAPTLAFSGGGGSGAAATASLLPYNQVILSSVPSSSSIGVQPSVGGGFIAYQYECDLIVPAARVGYYATGSSFNAFTMPGTSQASQVIPAATVPAAVTAGLAAGVFTIYDSVLNTASTTTVASVETAINAACATAQTNMNAWNPWVNYLTFFNPITAAWTAQGVQ